MSEQFRLDAEAIEPETPGLQAIQPRSQRQDLTFQFR
jgi:hypothetical protein